MPNAPNNAADPIASRDTQITARPTKRTPVVASIFQLALCALKDVADGRAMPLAPARRCDTTSVQRCSNLPQRRGTSLLGLSDDRENICSKPLSLGCHGFHRAPPGHMEL